MIGDLRFVIFGRRKGGHRSRPYGLERWYFHERHEDHKESINQVLPDWLVVGHFGYWKAAALPPHSKSPTVSGPSFGTPQNEPLPDFVDIEVDYV